MAAVTDFKFSAGHMFEGQLLNDDFNQANLLVILEKDRVTYHSFNRSVNGKALHFDLNKSGQLTDKKRLHYGIGMAYQRLEP